MARVLIIEDNPGILFILKEVLTNNGHEVTTIKDGLLAMQRLDKDPAPDVVLLDYMLPSLSGKKIIEKMIESSRLRSIPRILMSGTTPKSNDFPDKNSYQAFINKPFDIFYLVKVVQDCLNLDPNKQKLA